ncbi:MAG: ferredoxin family protein [Fervidicoccus sp.]
MSISQIKKEKKTLDEIMKEDKWEVDEKPHIVVDYEQCEKCQSKPCLYLCPAGCYTLSESGKIMFNHEGCLECGTCRVICPLKAIKWEYPEPGKGIHYRYG